MFSSIENLYYKKPSNFAAFNPFYSHQNFNKLSLKGVLLPPLMPPFGLCYERRPGGGDCTDKNFLKARLSATE